MIMLDDRTKSDRDRSYKDGELYIVQILTTVRFTETLSSSSSLESFAGRSQELLRRVGKASSRNFSGSLNLKFIRDRHISLTIRVHVDGYSTARHLETRHGDYSERIDQRRFEQQLLPRHWTTPDAFTKGMTILLARLLVLCTFKLNTPDMSPFWVSLVAETSFSFMLMSTCLTSYIKLGHRL